MRLALPFRIGRILGEVDASATTLNHKLISRAVVERCHALGVAVLAWTVDDHALLRQLDELGVDGVITNDPRIFRATLQA
jgi:glycerophosphoryl diester phosphodiesterase